MYKDTEQQKKKKKKKKKTQRATSDKHETELKT